MPSFALHHLTVQTRSSLPGDPAVDPGALLLAGFPPAEDWRRPALVITLEPAAEALPAPEGPALLAHGDVTVHPEAGAMLVVGPRARVRVGERGDRIEGRVAAGASPREVAEIELMLALTLALRRHGLYHLHAAATVSPAGKVTLVAGTGGAGKSTLAAALVAAGHGFLGDDVVLVGPGGALLAFPRPFHLSPASARAVGVDAGPPLATTGKSDVDAGAAFPGRFRWFAPAPDLVLLPRIEPAAATVLEPATRAEVLGALLSLSAFAASSLPAAVQQRAGLAVLVDGARPVRVALGRDLLEDAPGTVARIEAALAAPA